MGSLIDLSHANNTAVVGPLSLGKLYKSEQVFGLSSASSHSCSHSFSSSRAPDQDAYSYRKIGPAIVLKSYQPKNSSLESASSASSNLQSEDSDNYSIRAPFTYAAADLIYAELGLAEPNHYNPVDGEQMPPLLQLDQDSLDTQAEQSYRTAVTTTSHPALAHTDDALQSCNFDTTKLTNQTQLTDHLDLLSDDGAPLPASSESQSQTDSSVSQLIPSLLLENPGGNSEPLLPDYAMVPSAPKEILVSEPEPGSCLSNISAVPSDQVPNLPPLAEMQQPLLNLDDVEAPAENSLKISVPMESHIDESHTPSVSNPIIVLQESAGDLNSGLPQAEERKPSAVNTSETSQNDSIRLIGTCPISSRSEVTAKCDDQVTIDSTVVQSSRPASTVNPSSSRSAPEKGVENVILNKTEYCPSKPDFAVNDLNTSAHAPSAESTLGKPALDPPPAAPADTKAENTVSISLSPEVIRQGDLTTCAGTDIPTCNLNIGANKPTDPSAPSKPLSITQAAPVVPCKTSPATKEDNVATARGEKRVSTNTFSEGANATFGENLIPNSGKDTSLMIDKEASNDGTDKAPMSASMSSKQASRMRSISGFFKTLNKKQSIKAEVLNSPGSASIKSSEEEKSQQGIKALPKRKSLSSLKVKARFSSFYRATDEPVPTLPKAPEPPRISEEKREVVAVEGETTPLRKCETRPPATPKSREQPPAQAARATSQFIPADEVKATKRTQQYKMSHAKRGLRSRSQTIIPPSASPIENLDKPFASVVGELGSASFPRPKTLRKKRTFNAQVSTPVLKDITLSGLISKLMRKNAQKAESA